MKICWIKGKDNKTEICPKCGIVEALEAFRNAIGDDDAAQLNLFLDEI